MTEVEDDPLHYERLARVYLSSPTNEYYRPKIEIERGRARIVIEARPDMHHAASAVHGSHLFKLLDDAAFFAANSLVPDVFVLTATFTTHFLRPVAEGPLTAEGEVVQSSRRMLWADSVLRDASGRQLARGNGTFMPSRIPLGPEIGYR